MKEQKGYDSSFTFKIHRKCKYQFILKKLTFKGYRFNLSPLYTAMVDNRTIILFPLKPQPKKRNQKSKNVSNTFTSHLIVRNEDNTAKHSTAKKKREKKKKKKKKKRTTSHLTGSASRRKVSKRGKRKTW